MDDGTTNETRLGAVRDIQFAVEQAGLEDYLVIAGDNLLAFSLRSFVAYAAAKGTICTMRYWEVDVARLHKSGVAKVDAKGKILSFEEKPASPRSNWCTPPFYYYLASDVARIPEAIAGGCGTDTSGSLVAWMCRHSAQHSMAMPGRRYYIGDIANYERVQEEYKGIQSC